MKSRSGNEVVGYVIREGKERRKGRYLAPTPVDWTTSRAGAYVYPYLDAAETEVKLGGGRVVLLTRSAPKKLVATEEDSARYYAAVAGAFSKPVREANMLGLQAVLDGRAADLRRLGSVGEPAKDAQPHASDAKGAALPSAVSSGAPAPSHAGAAVISEELIEKMRLAMTETYDTVPGYIFGEDSQSRECHRAMVRAVLALYPTPLERARFYDKMRQERDIARADLARMTEQRDASTERERGLAAKLEVVREAAK